MSKRLLLIAATTGYQTRVFAEAALRAGYEVQLASDRCHNLDDPWGDGAIAIRFHQPERAAAIIAAQQRLDGIVAVGDRPAHVAAMAAAALGLPHNPPESVLACRNKHEARRRFEQAGLPVPAYRRVRLDTDPKTAALQSNYPCVLKPLGLSASRGVIRVDSAVEFTGAFGRIRKILASPDLIRMHEEQDEYLQIEDFIEGREFALEGILSDGRLQVLAIFDKPDPLDGPYFEETIYATPSRSHASTQAAIVEATAKAVQALGLTHGPIHAEMRVNDRGVWMLEVAARPIGGLCARVLKFNDGSGLEELVCRHAAGDPIGSTTLADPARAVMMIPIPREGIYTGAAGVDEARAVPGIEEVAITAKQGQRLIPLPEGASYLGFIFSRGHTPEHAEQAVREAHNRLSFEILGALSVV